MTASFESRANCFKMNLGLIAVFILAGCAGDPPRNEPASPVLSEPASISAVSKPASPIVIEDVTLSEALYEIRRQLQIVSDALVLEELMRTERKASNLPEPLDMCLEDAKVALNTVAVRSGGLGVEFKLVKIPIGGGFQATGEWTNTQAIEVNVGELKTNDKDLRDRIGIFDGDRLSSHEKLDEIVNKLSDAELAILIWNARRNVQLGLVESRQSSEETAEGLLNPNPGSIAELSPKKLTITAGLEFKKKVGGKIGIDILVFAIGPAGERLDGRGQTLKFVFENRNNTKAKCSQAPDVGPFLFG